MDCIVHRVAKRVGHNSATLTFKERRNVDSKLVSFREVEAHVRVPMSTLPPLSPTPRQVALTLSQNGAGDTPPWREGGGTGVQGGGDKCMPVTDS